MLLLTASLMTSLIVNLKEQNNHERSLVASNFDGLLVKDSRSS